jgi:hypothetical protein
MTDAFVIILMVLIGYLWASRGFFSSFLHMTCCLIAGAVAFALWEPAAYFFMSSSSASSSWLIDLSWTLGLIAPFVVTLAIIRPIADKVVRWNLDFDTLTNYIGGGACGLVSALITVGVIVLAIGYLPSKADIIGFTPQPMEYEGNGSLVRKSALGLVVPADTMTAGFFTMLADSTFFPDSGETLSKWRPHMADEGPLLRKTYPPPDGGSRHLNGLKSFELLSRYSVKAGKEWQTDFMSQAKKQTATGVDGDPITPATIEGIVIKFEPNAKEKSGRVVVGAGQVRLIARNENAEPDKRSIAIQPLAVISAADGASGRLGRWRFDTPDAYIASVGGGEGDPMVFEFPVPAGYSPIAVVVKGVRENLEGKAATKTFASIAERDTAIQTRAIASKVVNVDASNAPTIKPTIGTAESFIRFSNSIPFGMVIVRDALKGLEINERGYIIAGEARFERKDLENRGIERQLQVLGFDNGDDTAVMLVDMDDRNPEFGLLTDRLQSVDDKAQAASFLDEQGQQYLPIGYIFEGANQVWFKFDPSAPMRTINGDPLVRISRSSPGQKLTLIYRVSKGVKLKQFVVGDKAIVQFKPLIDAPKQ